MYGIKGKMEWRPAWMNFLIFLEITFSFIPLEVKGDYWIGSNLIGSPQQFNIQNKTYNYTVMRIESGLGHWVNDKLFDCGVKASEDNNSQWEGRDEYINYCVTPQLQYDYREINEEGWIGGAEFVEKATTNVFFEAQHVGQNLWFAEWHDWSSQRKLQEHYWAEDRDLRRTRFMYYEPFRSGLHTYLLCTLIYYAIAVSLLLITVQFNAGLVRFMLLLYYLRGFIFTPVRKLIRWIIVSIEVKKRQRMWWLAPPLFRQMKPSWRLWYFCRNHMLEERPYFLVYREEPNVINYSLYFLAREDLTERDLQIYHIQWIEQLLEFKDQYPVIIAYLIKKALGRKFEHWFSMDLKEKAPSKREKLKRPKPERKDSTTSSTNSDSDASRSDDSEETKLKKQRSRNKKRGDRYAKLRRQRELDFFKEHRKKADPLMNLNPRENPFRIDHDTDLTPEQIKALKNLGIDILEHIKTRTGGIPPEPTIIDPKVPQKYVIKEDSERQRLLCLINAMAWWKHVDLGDSSDSDELQGPDKEMVKNLSPLERERLKDELKAKKKAREEEKRKQRKAERMLRKHQKKEGQRQLRIEQEKADQIRRRAKRLRRRARQTMVGLDADSKLDLQASSTTSSRMWIIPGVERPGTLDAPSSTMTNQTGTTQATEDNVKPVEYKKGEN